ncbi:MAG: site-specific DNA-methyltransferase [Planctomycetaceae bacterium]|nr:MAG: site-specific DNA-methyltransferase [Planctomycetaceae bacterium]
MAFLSDKDFLPNESVDLIYLDPPFNSQQNYNVLFKETADTPEAAQIKAFEDTWTWDQAANKALSQLHNDPSVPAPLVELTKTFMSFLKASPMMAYLVQMSIRLVHMHRVLKPTGSLYLHCDPTASHYLKMVLDAIFEPANFVNEIVWKRTHAHSGAKKYGCVHDVILFYAKSPAFIWHTQHMPYSSDYKKNFFRFADEDGRRYRATILTGAGTRTGSSGKPWRGIDPTAVGRHWAIPGYVRAILPTPKTTTVQEALDQLEAANRIIWPKKKGGTPHFKQYMDDLPGTSVQDVWTDIPPISAVAAERLGYPTQKPLALLKRIIAASSKPGNVILDPFCGCGTTIDAVETINRENRKARRRRWIGIDVTHIAVNLIKHRLTRFKPAPEYDVIGEPQSIAAARRLAKDDPYQFQFWALGLIGARPIGRTKKKGADRGIDGVRYFIDELKAGQSVTKNMLVQVKGGHVKSGDIRDFVGTLARENAEMGVFITLEEPSGPMNAEAATAGMYASPWDKQSYPRVQILTISDLLADSHKPNPRCLQIPGGASGPSATLPNAEKHTGNADRQGELGFTTEED